MSSSIVHRVPRTAIFMTRQQDGIPTPLLHNIKHNGIVHERVVLLSVNVEETPHLSDEEFDRAMTRAAFGEDVPSSPHRLIFPH